VWLILSAIVLRLTSARAAVVVLGAVLMLGASEQFLALAGSGLPLRRKLAGYALAAALALFLTLLLVTLRGQSLTADVLGFLLAVIVVALVGGFVPAVLEAVAGSLLLHFFAVAHPGKFAIGGVGNAAVLGGFLAVAVAVSFGVEGAAQRTRQAARADDAARYIAEADRMRTALLAAVSHDLRSPLAAAKAAVSCLRSHHLELTAEDHNELLAAADESLDQLTHLADSMLDVSRLQAGSLPVFPRPSDLGEIIASSLSDVGPLAQAVTVHVPGDLPQVMADPAIMERVIVNLVGNALRYAPVSSPLQLTASALGDRVELRVIDCGPGIPEADRDRAFMPFRRLGDTSKTTGVGLGLAVSRGLTEAMGGAVEPEETPGGGLTMVVSLPAATQAGRGADAYQRSDRRGDVGLTCSGIRSRSRADDRRKGWRRQGLVHPRWRPASGAPTRHPSPAGLRSARNPALLPDPQGAGTGQERGGLELGRAPPPPRPRSRHPGRRLREIPG
jgi:two-component system sensor histidine kinase KdpD